MIYYALLPFAAIGLVVLQTTLADIFFSGRLTLELSLIAVIYAGFRMDLLPGGMLAFMMGFVFDCVSAGPVLGLFTSIYLLMFLLSFFVSLRIAAGKMYLIALFSLFCALVESLTLWLFFYYVYDIDRIGSILNVFVPQILLVGVLSVGFFSVLRKWEGLMYGKTVQSRQRTGAGGFPTKA
jgi:hypothetical protein